MKILILNILHTKHNHKHKVNIIVHNMWQMKFILNMLSWKTLHTPPTTHKHKHQHAHTCIHVCMHAYPCPCYHTHPHHTWTLPPTCPHMHIRTHILYICTHMHTRARHAYPCPCRQTHTYVCKHYIWTKIMTKLSFKQDIV